MPLRGRPDGVIWAMGILFGDINGGGIEALPGSTDDAAQMLGLLRRRRPGRV